MFSKRSCPRSGGPEFMYGGRCPEAIIAGGCISTGLPLYIDTLVGAVGCKTGLSIGIPRGRGGAEPVWDGGTFWGERPEG